MRNIVVIPLAGVKLGYFHLGSYLDVPTFFYRHQRYQIIRNVEEYIFIHECILDHVTCMNRIDIIPRDLADVIGKQREVNEDG